MRKSPSKWTVIAASILAVALHAAPFLWVELHEETTPVAAAVPVIHQTEDAVVEKATEIATSGGAARSNSAD
jgi:hypothetical protein